MSEYLIGEKKIGATMGDFATSQDLSLKKMGFWMLKVAKLDGEASRELRDDPRATALSVSLVAIVALSYGAGWSLFGYLVGDISTLGLVTFTLANVAAGLGIALFWSATSFVIVTRLFRGTVRYSGLFRPFFFSWSPGLMFILMSIPIPAVSDAVRVVGTTWIVLANLVAVKNAVGISFQQSMVTFIISAVFLAFIGSFILSLI